MFSGVILLFTRNTTVNHQGGRKVYPMNREKLEDLFYTIKSGEFMNRRAPEPEPEEKKSNVLLWVLAIIGAVAAIAGIAYAVYRYFTPDYLEDFEDDFDDEFEDEDFEECLEDVADAVEETVEDAVDAVEDAVK